MLLCVAAFASLSSCSKDNEDLIVGKWKCIHSYYSYGDYEDVDDEVGFIWEFKSDGTMTTNDPHDISYGANVQYTISGSTLTLGGMIGYTIDELTSTTLKLSGSSMGTSRLEFAKQ